MCIFATAYAELKAFFPHTENIYNTTKVNVVMFAKCLANKLIKYNIYVNTVNPGLILTLDLV